MIDNNICKLPRSLGVTDLTVYASTPLERMHSVFARCARPLCTDITIESVVSMHTESAHPASSLPLSYLWAVTMCIFADVTANRKEWLDWLQEHNPFRKNVTSLCEEIHCDDVFVWATAWIQAYRDQLCSADHVQAVLLKMKDKSLEGAICGLIQLASFYRAEGVLNRDLHVHLHSLLGQLDTESWEEAEFLLPARHFRDDAQSLYEALCGLDIVFKWAQASLVCVRRHTILALGEALFELRAMCTARISDEVRAIVRGMMPYLQQIMKPAEIVLIREFFTVN